MERFGASRTVIREAVTILSIRGLVENRLRFRPTVRKPDFETAVNTLGSVIHHLLAEPGGVGNLFETRVFIERGLVRDAAEFAKKDDISRLRAALKANQEAIPSLKDFYLTDTAFHGVFYQISGNPIMPAVHHAFKSWLASIGSECQVRSNVTRSITAITGRFSRRSWIVTPMPRRKR